MTFAYPDPSTSVSAVTRFNTGMTVRVADLVPPQTTADNQYWLKIYNDLTQEPEYLYIQIYTVPQECWWTNSMTRSC